MYKSKFGRNSVKQKGVQFWNSTDNILKEITNLKCFRKEVKDSIIPYSDA